MITEANPKLWEGETENATQTTIFGAPCDMKPPYTDLELQREFFGCQNVPTQVWMKKGPGSIRRKCKEEEKSDGSSNMNRAWYRLPVLDNFDRDNNRPTRHHYRHTNRMPA